MSDDGKKFILVCHQLLESFFTLLQRFLHHLTFGNVPGLHQVLIGRQRQLRNYRIQPFGYLQKLGMAHRGHFIECAQQKVFLYADFTGISPYGIICLRFITHLAYQPVGNVLTTNDDTGSGIP
ncbi:MAG: hypothetical protein BWY72_02049 [Bacteroidetes bacterium ADurb.Bin416]|nr:MAG: hypothetical protein BWY72_02049 [Bacteroidetes bacterium ADurb.Bin416]